MYTVYVHISPSKKMYVGITRRKVQERWKKGGKGYFTAEDSKRGRFENAIRKYGWDNFQHIILFDNNLTEDEAFEIEKFLISELDLTNPEKGYNQDSGGKHGRHCSKTKQKIGLSGKERYKNTRYVWINNGEEERLIDITKKNLPENYSLGRLYTEEQHQRYLETYRSKDHPKVKNRKNLDCCKDSKWYNNGIKEIKVFPDDLIPEGFVSGRLQGKGFPKGEANPAHKQKGIPTGKPMSEEAKRKLSETKKRNNSFKDKVWYNNGEKEIQVDLNSELVPEGFLRGRLEKETKDRKKVYKLSANGNIVEEYLSIESACVSNNISRYRLMKAIENNTLLDGFYWKLVEAKLTTNSID